MIRASKMRLALIAAGACTVSVSASADNLLGFYVGAGVGESTVRSDNGFDPYYPGDSHPHHTGLAIRGEYQRISSTFGDPDAFMVSATWTF